MNCLTLTYLRGGTDNELFDSHLSQGVLTMSCLTLISLRGVLTMNCLTLISLRGVLTMNCLTLISLRGG